MDENGRKLLREMASYKDLTWKSMHESIRQRMALIQKERGKNVRERAIDLKLMNLDPLSI